LTKPFGSRFRIPPVEIDVTAEMVGKRIAFVGGIAPAQVTTPQDGEQPKRDDDKADA